MTVEVNRKLEYADRTAIQQADQTIKRDVVRALVELITNADDSCRRIEQKGDAKRGDNFGLIKIAVRRRHENASLKVSDWAEGVSAERMDECVGTYAGETSGVSEGLQVRGYFGRGLKEAMLGLGMGTVCSICDDKFARSSIAVEEAVPRYKRDKPIRATRTLRTQFGIPTGSGTIVEVIIHKPGVRFPLIQNLRTRLERHYALREILSNLNRKVILVELDQRGREKKEYHLQYRFPPGEKILSNSVNVHGYSGAKFEIEVFRSDEPLEGPSSDRESADGGFIVKSPRAVLDLSLFKFEQIPPPKGFLGRSIVHIWINS